MLRLYLLTPISLGTHTYVHIATLHCGGFLRWLIFVDTHLYKGFCGFGASGWKGAGGLACRRFRNSFARLAYAFVGNLLCLFIFVPSPWFVMFLYVTLVVELSHICDSILRYMVVFMSTGGRRLVHVFLNPVPELSADMDTFFGFDLGLALHFRYLRPFLHSFMGSVGEFMVLWVGYTGTPFGVLGIYFELVESSISLGAIEAL